MPNLGACIYLNIFYNLEFSYVKPGISTKPNLFNTILQV